MDKVDCVVVGAGVIGLAVARRLARSGREVIVLEEAEGIGTVTSSRNSEVIHAGIYYRPEAGWRGCAWPASTRSIATATSTAFPIAIAAS